MARGQQFLDELHDGVLLGDGAVGSELFSRGAPTELGVERLNLLAPDMVRQLHADYVAAGSRVLETNTFSANRSHLLHHHAENDVREIILAGTRLAREAAGDRAYVAGSVGPLTTIEGEPISLTDSRAFFTEQLSALLEGDVDLLLLESFTEPDELLDVIALARALTDLPIVAQMAYGQDGRVVGGESAEVIARRCLDAGVNLVGANCGFGAPAILAATRKMAPLGAPMSAYLNAGFPEQVEGRLLYLATPEYLAARAIELVRLGVRLIGGCCGTGPETIRWIGQALQEQRHPTTVTPRAKAPVPPARQIAAPPAQGNTPVPILVELDSPANLETDKVLANAHALKAAGVTALTVADNPLASVRVDTMMMAGVLQQEVGVPVIPHLTGRDRNRIALQSSIMGAHLAGLRSLLCVTGDPIRFCQEPNTSGVFDVTSVGLVRLVAECNAGHRLGGSPTAFDIGVALNPNVRSLQGQIDKLLRKVEAGARFALTQPLFEEERLDQLQEALAAAGIEIPIYVGILPLVSARNAEFLHNEVPGMRIPDAVRERLAEFEQVADQRAAGLEVALDLVRQFTPRVHGLYLITPRHRVELIVPLIHAARQTTGAYA